MSISGFPYSAPSYPLYPPPPYQNQAAVSPVKNLPQDRLTITKPPPSYQSLATSAAYYPDKAFDQFLRKQTQPFVHLKDYEKWALMVLHPQQYRDFTHMAANQAVGEGLFETLFMYNKVSHALDPASRKQFKNLLKKGILQNNKTDDGHSALYHLYAILMTRRAQGYNNKILLKETIAILNKPFVITQKFGPLAPNRVQQILLARNYPGLNYTDVTPPAKPLGPQDLNVDNSATCVSSSVMDYMADKEPAELARHLNELTSPLNAFFEKVKLSEISPENPNEALDRLKNSKVRFFESAPGEVTVKVENPPAGKIRAVDSQRFPANSQYRNGVEAAYQSALTYLATHSYDPANDMRDGDAPGETSKGLTADEKTWMETIIKENGGVQSVTYQVDQDLNLLGYNRSFEQTMADMLKSLRMKEPVIVGTTDTDQTGAIVMGHEITLTGAYIDPTDNQLKFIVADSDDGIPEPSIKTARELIPTIHHAGLPLALAALVNKEITANAGSCLIPDQKDARNFNLLKLKPEAEAAAADPANAQGQAPPETQPSGQTSGSQPAPAAPPGSFQTISPPPPPYSQVPSTLPQNQPSPNQPPQNPVSFPSASKTGFTLPNPAMQPFLRPYYPPRTEAVGY